MGLRIIWAESLDFFGKSQINPRATTISWGKRLGDPNRLISAAIILGWHKRFLASDPKINKFCYRLQFRLSSFEEFPRINCLSGNQERRTGPDS